MQQQYDIQEILNYLPHRYPFLLLDRVLKLIPGESVLALKNVTINEPFFQGHFPGMPVMPGVMILEAMGQAGGVLAYESFSEGNRDRLIYFSGMDKVRFRRRVVPGDQIIFEIKMLKRRLKMIKMAGEARVDDQRVAEAEMMAVFGDE